MVAPFEEPVQWSFRSYYRNTSLVGPYYTGHGQPLSSLQDVPDWVREYGLDRYFTGGFSYYKGALGSRVVSLSAGAAGEGPGGIPNAIQGVEPDHPCKSDGDALEYCLELILQETP